MKLGDSGNHMNVETVPTGSLSLDVALGLGGVPKGRIVEIYGPESSEDDRSIAYGSRSPETAVSQDLSMQSMHWIRSCKKNIGVDIDNLYISQPDNGEQGLEIAKRPWCVPEQWTLSSWTLWQHWCQKQGRSRAIWEIPT